MAHAHITDFLKQSSTILGRGPIALIFIEDDVEVASTINHALERGFKAVVVFTPPWMKLPEHMAGPVHQVHINVAVPNFFVDAVNRVIEVVPAGTWLYYGFNGEYIFYPFCETRTIGEAALFATEERRDSILTFVVDAYPAEIHGDNCIDLQHAMIDKAGYYALVRTDAYNNHMDRQMNFFGGLRWRFEEHVPESKRRIDRVSLFRAKPGLRLQPDHTFNEAEYNTYQCQWHHSLSAALVSFRVSKALQRNPGSRGKISSFVWPNSVPLEWHSQQFLDLGLMEPGQWF